MSFDVAFTELIDIEGGYSDDERDPGNWTGGKVNVGALKGTNYGISAAAYPDEDIINMTLVKAKNIYYRDFWSLNKCSTFPDVIGSALFKQSVNMGCAGAAKALQRSLKTPADGAIGQITIGLASSGPVIQVLGAFLTECALEYVSMQNFKVEGHGWLSRIVKTALEARIPL